MKLKHARTYSGPIFWIFMIALVGLIWYLFFTTNGSIRRMMLLKNPKVALTSKLVKVKSENMTTMYTFLPKLQADDKAIITIVIAKIFG